MDNCFLRSAAGALLRRHQAASLRLAAARAARGESLLSASNRACDAFVAPPRTDARFPVFAAAAMPRRPQAAYAHHARSAG